MDVVVWGEQAKHAGRHLAKGRRVAIKGRLQQALEDSAGPYGSASGSSPALVSPSSAFDAAAGAGDATLQSRTRRIGATLGLAPHLEPAEGRALRQLTSPTDALD